MSEAIPTLCSQFSGNLSAVCEWVMFFLIVTSFVFNTFLINFVRKNTRNHNATSKNDHAKIQQDLDSIKKQLADMSKKKK